MTKQCTKCKEFKPFTEFYKHKSTKDGYHTYCKPCYCQGTLAAKHKDRYGLTTEQIKEMKKEGCALCGTTKNLHVDHNHNTGEVRGILCTNCNRGIGHLQDSPDLLRKAIAYLESKGNYSKWQN